MNTLRAVLEGRAGGFRKRSGAEGGAGNSSSLSKPEPCRPYELPSRQGRQGVRPEPNSSRIPNWCGMARCALSLPFSAKARYGIRLNLGTSVGRAGSPLHAAVVNPRVRVYHGGAHGVTRPTCPTVAKNCSRQGHRAAMPRRRIRRGRARKGLAQPSVPAPFPTPAERGRSQRSALTLPHGRKLQNLGQTRTPKFVR